MDKKKMKGGLIILLILLIGGVFLAGRLGGAKLETEEETKLPEATTQTARYIETEPETEKETETEPETEPYQSPIDFEALWETNPDVIGWITIPDTNIDYPILQGEDNDRYLHTDLEGNESVAGSIFLDFEDEPDFSSLHNILYGHRMKNGSMFKDVIYFREQEFFDEHDEIIIYTPEREIHLKPLAALYTSPDAIRRKSRFKSQESFDAYLEEMTKGADVFREPEEVVGRLYSLVTCSYEFANARTILYAYEAGEEENSKEDE